MENFRAFDESADFAGEDEPAMEAPPEIGIDERRMHVRAYNYWVSLLDGRPYPSIRDLEPHNLDDFGPHSVLLDFTAGSEDAAVPFIGRALREECDLHGEIRTIADVPGRSLLSRLTDHYLQIIANCAPIGFEAEFVGQRGVNTMYRGILMPLSSDGDTIDYIYGVINWKEVADQDTAAGIAREAYRAAASLASAEASPVWADGPSAAPLAFADGSSGDADDDQHDLDLALGPDAGLADRLCAARETAEAVRTADARSRSALYRALGHAYDFALAAEAEPEDYAEILDDAGLKVQARAPMTPIVKLIFGAGHDKARLTEYAAALSHARREDVTAGGFMPFLEHFSGGLKGIIQAERRARRPEPRP
ncbi:PAS domain-containing protein, partial [Allosphingosinicella sp.]|uniref:PAS domain-containing protein n=1 Tax=Allosphingosinicella sp. TaxID=2823234 RepID=UPI002FC1DEF1